LEAKNAVPGVFGQRSAKSVVFADLHFRAASDTETAAHPWAATTTKKGDP
jgi:hypothetical protein